jgi:broad specificity phosphatase PhoE
MLRQTGSDMLAIDNVWGMSVKRQPISAGSKRERETADILLSELGLMTKVQRLIDLGLEEKTAHDLVELYQKGQMNPLEPVYYERLDLDHDRLVS